MPAERSNEQDVMERRFNLPYNWVKGDHTRHIRQKTGIWQLAHKLAGNIKGKKVLDAGCGDGWYSEKMLRAGASVSGIDYSERAIKHASAIVPGVVFSTASILDLPFPDETFDVVFSFQVIEHVPPADAEKAAHELARVTKKSGTIIVSVPSVRRKISAAHFQHFTEGSLTGLFAPLCTTTRVFGQDRRTILLWLIERFIQNRFYTLESIGAWFNKRVYLHRYNETTAALGDNLMITATRA